MVTACPIRNSRSPWLWEFFYAPIPPENHCHSGTKCPLARGFSRKLLPFGDKVPSGGGFLPKRYLIRGQKYLPRRPYGISSRKPLPFGDKVPSGGGFLPKRYLIRGQKYLPRRPHGISSRKPLPFGDKVCQRLSNCRTTFAEK